MSELLESFAKFDSVFERRSHGRLAESDASTKEQISMIVLLIVAYCTILIVSFSVYLYVFLQDVIEQCFYFVFSASKYRYRLD